MPMYSVDAYMVVMWRIAWLRGVSKWSYFEHICRQKAPVYQRTSDISCLSYHDGSMDPCQST
eukprot:4523019-Prorocentrum_lima.AAC.1